MCFTVQLSRFLSVFDSFDILSYHFVLVKNFFIFEQLSQKYFLKTYVFINRCHFSFVTAIIDYHIFRCLSITFFNFY